MIRAKFAVSSVKKHFYRSSGKVVDAGTEVFLTPQYDTSIPEDQRFAQATPSGEMRLMITNPPAAAYLEPGQEFYVDFTRVETPAAA